MGNINRFNLEDLITRHDLDIFVETGTLYGDGVDYALQFNFKKIISIEIDFMLFKNAKEKYKNNTRVDIIHGNSADILKNLVLTLNGNCLFWLDAHFPGADSHKLPYDYEKDIYIILPLEYEIRTIYNSR